MKTSHLTNMIPIDEAFMRLQKIDKNPGQIWIDTNNYILSLWRVALVVKATGDNSSVITQLYDLGKLEELLDEKNDEELNKLFPNIIMIKDDKTHINEHIMKLSIFIKYILSGGIRAKRISKKDETSADLMDNVMRLTLMYKMMTFKDVPNNDYNVLHKFLLTTLKKYHSRINVDERIITIRFIDIILSMIRDGVIKTVDEARTQIYMMLLKLM